MLPTRSEVVGPTPGILEITGIRRGTRQLKEKEHGTGATAVDSVVGSLCDALVGMIGFRKPRDSHFPGHLSTANPPGSPHCGGQIDIVVRGRCPILRRRFAR